MSLIYPAVSAAAAATTISSGCFWANMFPAELASSPADVMVTVWNEDSFSESIALATELRKEGLRVDLYPEADKLAKQFKYARSRGIPVVAIIGDDERARGEVAIKNMGSNEQLTLPFE